MLDVSRAVVEDDLRWKVESWSSFSFAEPSSMMISHSDGDVTASGYKAQMGDIVEVREVTKGDSTIATSISLPVHRDSSVQQGGKGDQSRGVRVGAAFSHLPRVIVRGRKRGGHGVQARSFAEHLTGDVALAKGPSSDVVSEGHRSGFP